MKKGEKEEKKEKKEKIMSKIHISNAAKKLLYLQENAYYRIYSK